MHYEVYYSIFDDKKLGGPPPSKDEDSPTDNQDRLMIGGDNLLEGGQTPCAAHTSNVQGTSSTKQNTSQDNQHSYHPDNVLCYQIKMRGKKRICKIL